MCLSFSIVARDDHEHTIFGRHRHAVSIDVHQSRRMQPPLIIGSTPEAWKDVGESIVGPLNVVLASTNTIYRDERPMTPARRIPAFIHLVLNGDPRLRDGRRTGGDAEPVRAYVDPTSPPVNPCLLGSPNAFV
mmetsp:Transcript_21946/g.49744  ORF Transcript_21946/g.49744 Transcript_21946/m.49744 type:complete len:133 (+) Transcript_21946:158-556(+)